MPKVLIASVSQPGAPVKAAQHHRPDTIHLLCSDSKSDVVASIKQQLAAFEFGLDIEVSPHNYLQTYEQVFPVLHNLTQSKNKVVVNATGGTVFMRLGLIYAAHQLNLVPESYNEALGPDVLVDIPPPPRR